MVERHEEQRSQLEGELGHNLDSSPFIYNPISPNKRYNREEFLRAQDSFNDLEKYANTLKEKPFDLSAREKLSRLLTGDSSFHSGMAPESVARMAKTFYDGSLDALAKYTKTNFDEMFDKLNGKALQRLLFSIRLYNTGDRDHDSLANLIGDVKSMQEIENKEGEEHTSAIRSYVAKKIESRNLSDTAKKVIKQLLGDGGFVLKTFRRDSQIKNQILSKYLSTAEGELDENKVRVLIKDGLKKAEEEYDKETNEGRRNDIWEDNLRPYYLEIAKNLFPVEKGEYENDSEDLKEMNERENRRRSSGMAA
ncbi:MAG: hypothetical protein Q7S74_06705 [Nanoarchaeota archaeon]|nr:hypothetical protein [Nanoarchaeota archaeon]